MQNEAEELVREIANNNRQIKEAKSLVIDFKNHLKFFKKEKMQSDIKDAKIGLRHSEDFIKRLENENKAHKARLKRLLKSN
jgi:hypothetical protein